MEPFSRVYFPQFDRIWSTKPLLSGLFLPVFQIISLCVNWDLLHALRLISRLEAWSPTVTEFSLRGSSLGPLPMEQLHTNKVHLKQLGSAGATGLPKLPLIRAPFASTAQKRRPQIRREVWVDSAVPGSWPQNHWDSQLPKQPEQGEQLVHTPVVSNEENQQIEPLHQLFPP